MSAPAASVAPALVPVPEPVYSLGELARRVPTATPDDVMRYLGHRDRPSLVELGRTVSTERISTDCARIYGQAIDFLATATAEQKAALLGVSERFLGVCVFAAEKGQTANAARQGQAKAAKTSQDTRKNAAVALLASAERTRDQLHAVLEFVIAEDPAFTAVLDAAHSKSSDPAELSGSLTGLVGLAEVVVASKDPDLIARRTDTGLTAALLTTVRALAEQVKKSGTAAKATRAATPVSQGEVDFWDGVNLTLVSRLLSLWQAAHALQPAIPRLYVIALYRALHGSPRKKPAEPTPPPAK